MIYRPESAGSGSDDEKPLLWPGDETADAEADRPGLRQIRGTGRGDDERVVVVARA